MSAGNLLALFDDIASLLDDVAILTKGAARKTAGVLGDDLALNAQQVSGVSADRELPVVWAVAKGSAVNKLILVPAALAISALAPWAVTPLLMLGGAFLCYEGFEKLAHRFLHRRSEDAEHHTELVAAVADPAVDIVAFERGKIKGAIRTDFILSAEIVVIALGTVATQPFWTRVSVLTAIAIGMTVGVYGLVAAIVKLDDLGLYLAKARDAVRRAAGRAIIATAPYLMKALSILGTAAMFMVGGAILVHGIPGGEEFMHRVTHPVAEIPRAGGVLSVVAGSVLDAIAGVIAGAIALGAVLAGKRVIRAVRPAAA